MRVRSRPSRPLFCARWFLAGYVISCDRVKSMIELINRRMSKGPSALSSLKTRSI